MEQIVGEVFSAGSPGLRASYTGQLWALRGRINVGDVMVMPMKTTRELALGRVTGGYHYLADEPDPSCRHVVDVTWEQTVPRSAIKQDLLYTLGSVISIFSPSRHEAVARLVHVLLHGADPGAQAVTGSSASATTGAAGPDVTVAERVVDEPEAEPDVAQLAHDQIVSRISEEFAGHSFTHLVAELLRAEGFEADEAPPGADGGIDITAGRGLLGLESPKLIVQVKTGQIGSEVVAQLNGLVVTHGADFGLLATWTGLSKPARDAVKHQRFKVKVWDSTDVVDSVLRNYDRLPDSISSRLPLHRVWMLRDE